MCFTFKAICYDNFCYFYYREYPIRYFYMKHSDIKYSAWFSYWVLLLYSISRYVYVFKISLYVETPVYNGPLRNDPLSVCAFLCTLLVQLIRNFTLSYHILMFPMSTFLVLHSFYVTIFLCWIFPMLHFFLIPLFSFFALSFTFLFFSCCTFSILHSFHFAFFQFYIFFILQCHKYIFSEQIFCRKFWKDCLFFMCFVNPVI